MKDKTGQLAKLNVEQIKSRNSKLSKKYMDFLDSNKDKIFTVELDAKNNYTTMYSLQEDISEVKWLFWEEDLKFIENNMEENSYQSNKL